MTSSFPGGIPPRTDRRRLVALATLVCLAAGAAVGLAQGLRSDARPETPAAQARPLSSAEAQRLATMRLHNYRDARAGVRATLGRPGRELRLIGSVDWGRTLIHLTVSGPGAGSDAGLLQAVPGVMATRAAAAPDASAPWGDGWRVRPASTGTAEPGPLESFVALLFAVANTRPDPADVLQQSDARWLGRQSAGGTTVDVLLGPAVPATPPSPGQPGPPVSPPGDTPRRGSLAAMGGAVRYWLDRDARLHRLEALLPGDAPVRVDFDRTQRRTLTAIDALGGRPVTPRPVSAAEARLLSRMRRTNLGVGGARVSLAVPTVPVANLRGAGWVDWRERTAYLAVRDLDHPAEPALIRAGERAVAQRAAPATWSVDRREGLPPLPAPTDHGWNVVPWQQRGDARGGLDLDLLIAEAMAVGSPGREDARALRASAAWLRADAIGGSAVAVFEIRKPAERGVARGAARLRYWVDPAGLLRRLELRTRSGAFAQLDLDPGETPALGAPPAT